MTKSNASANVVAAKQQSTAPHSMGNKQRLLYFKGHPNNLKEADLVKENRQINQQLSVFTNDVFSVFEFSKRERENISWAVLELINNSTAFNAK